MFRTRPSTMPNIIDYGLIAAFVIVVVIAASTTMFPEPAPIPVLIMTNNSTAD